MILGIINTFSNMVFNETIVLTTEFRYRQNIFLCITKFRKSLFEEIKNWVIDDSIRSFL